MRGFWYAPVVALLVGTQPLPGRAQDVTASGLWNQVQTIRWDATYAAWRPQHASAVCSPFTAPPQNVIDGPGASELWSHHCEQESIGTTTEWLFYAFSPRPPGTARSPRLGSNSETTECRDHEGFESDSSCSPFI